MTEAAHLEGVISLVGVDKAVKGLRSVGASVDETQGKFDTLDKTSASVSERMSQVGGTLMRRVSLPLLGVGIAATKMGMDFTAQMSKVASKSGAVGKDLETLRKQAIKLGEDTSFSATTAAQGMEILGAAGLKPKEILGAMPGLLDAAAASGEGLAATADVMANTLAQFGLEAADATRIADVLAQSSDMTQTSIVGMGEGLKYAGTTASQLGFSLEDTVGLMSKMAKAGIDASQSGTALRMGLMKLSVVPPIRALDKLDDISPKLAEIWQSAKPVPAKLGEMSAEFDKLDGTSRVAAAGLVFGTEASTGMLEAMRGGPAEMAKWSRALEDSTGVAAKKAKQNLDNLKGDVENAGGAIQSAFIDMQSAADGPMRSIAQGVEAAAKSFSSLPPAAQQAAVGLGLVAIAVGPMMMALSPMVTLLGGAATITRTAGVAIGSLAMAAGTAVPALASLSLVMAANPLLTGAIAIGAIAAAGLAVAGFGQSARQSGTDTAYAKQQLDEYQTAIDKLSGSLIGERQADIAVVQARGQLASAQQAVNAAEREHGRGSPQYVAALQAKRQASMQLDQSLNSQSQSQRKVAKDTEEATQKTRDAVRDYKQASDRVAELTERMKSLAPHTRMASRDGLMAKAAYQKLGEQLREAAGDMENAKGKAQTLAGQFPELARAAGKPTGALRTLKALLDSLPKDVQINVNTYFKEHGRRPPSNSQYGTHVPARVAASGGKIEGPGTATSDSIPAWLSNGEYVIKAASVAKYGEGFLDAVNAGAVQAFAAGGRVTRASANRTLGNWGVADRLTGSRNDARLARAEGTPQLFDDINAWKAKRDAADAQRKRWESFVRSASYRVLDRNGKADAQDRLAAARRDAQHARAELVRLRTPPEAGGDGTDATGLGEDPAAQAAAEAERRRIEAEQRQREADLAAQLAQAEQRARIAQGNLALSEAAVRTFGGSGDIGAARGANAWQSATGGTQIHFHSAVPYTADQARQVADMSLSGGQYNGLAGATYAPVQQIGA